MAAKEGVAQCRVCRQNGGGWVGGVMARRLLAYPEQDAVGQVEMPQLLGIGSEKQTRRRKHGAENDNQALQMTVTVET